MFKGIPDFPSWFARLTVAEYLTYWLNEIIKPNRAPLTYRTYETPSECTSCRRWGSSGSTGLASAMSSSGSTGWL
jgi:hypothetical protein